MIENIGRVYANTANVNTLQGSGTAKSNQATSTFESLTSVDKNSSVDLKNISPLAPTINSKGEVCTILSQKIAQSNTNKPAQVEDICNRYNSLKTKLVMGKKFMRNAGGLSLKLESKLEALMGSMTSALKNNTQETLSLHTCKTVSELDEKMETVEAKLDAAYNEFCAKMDILDTMTDMLPQLERLLEKNGNNSEIMDAFNEILDNLSPGLNVSGKNAKEINEKSQERINDLLEGDMAEKIKDFQEKIEEKEKNPDKEEPKNFFTDFKQTHTKLNLKPKRP